MHIPFKKVFLDKGKILVLLFLFSFSVSLVYALSSVTLNNGTTSVSLGTDVTSQSTALSPDIGAYKWTYSNNDFMNLNIPFNSGVPGSTQTDFSGKNNSGVINDDHPTQDAQYVQSCKVGGCVQFYGDNVGNTGGWIRVPYTADLMPATFTIEAWVNTTDGSQNQTLVANNSDCLSAGYALQINPNGLGLGKVGWLVGGNTWELSTTRVDNGAWHHVLVLYDGSVTKIFIDGTLEKTSPTFTAVLGSTRPFGIGGYPGFCGYYYTGKIDEVRLYPRALSSAEITQSYTDGNNGVGGPTIIKSNETLDGQIWNLTITPISSLGAIATAVASSNTVTVGTGAGSSTGSSTVQVALAGSAGLTLSVTTSTTSLTGQAVTTSESTVTGSTSYSITDNRGTGAGWTVSGTLEHMTAAIAGVKASGSGSGSISINSTNDYNGTLNPDIAAGDSKCFYELNFTSTTAFNVSLGPTTQSSCNVTDSSNTTGSTGTTVAIGSRGVKLNFSGTFASNDVWRIVVDRFYVASASLTSLSDPVSTTGTGSNTTGITKGSTGVWAIASSTSSVSNSRSLLVGVGGTAFGSFDQTVTHSWTLHRNPFTATYKGTFTITAV